MRMIYRICLTNCGEECLFRTMREGFQQWDQLLAYRRVRRHHNTEDELHREFDHAWRRYTGRRESLKFFEDYGEGRTISREEAVAILLRTIPGRTPF